MNPLKLFFTVPDEQNRAVSDVDSDASDEESAGSLNKLCLRLLNTTCDFIPYSESCNNPLLQNDQNENKTVLQIIIAKRKKSNPVKWSKTVLIFSIKKP